MDKPFMLFEEMQTENKEGDEGQQPSNRSLQPICSHLHDKELAGKYSKTHHEDGCANKCEVIATIHPPREVVLGLLATSPPSAFRKDAQEDHSMLCRMIVLDTDSEGSGSDSSPKMRKTTFRRQQKQNRGQTNVTASFDNE